MQGRNGNCQASWSSLSRVSAVFITGTRAAQLEATACPSSYDGGSAMPSDQDLIPTVRFSFTKTTGCSQTQSLQPTSLTHLISLVEAGSVPTLAESAILAIDT